MIAILLAFLSVAPVIATPDIRRRDSTDIHRYVLENDNVSDNTSTYRRVHLLKTSPRSLDLSPAFSNPGYSFDNWNTSADGVATSIRGRHKYMFSADLYALRAVGWAQAYTVTFCENDNVSD